MWVPGLALLRVAVLIGFYRWLEPEREPSTPRRAHDLKGRLPMLPFADNFLAGSLLSLLLPVAAADRVRGLVLGRTIAPAAGDPGTTAAPPPSVTAGPAGRRPGADRHRGRQLLIERRRRGRRPDRRRAWAVDRAAGSVARSACGVGLGAGLHRLQRRSRPVAGAAARHVASRPGDVGGGGAAGAGDRGAARPERPRCSRSASLRGRTVAMAFFDSHCNQACPLEGRALAAVGAVAAGCAAARARRRQRQPADTPASARAAVRKRGGWPGWRRGTG